MSDNLSIEISNYILDKGTLEELSTSLAAIREQEVTSDTVKEEEVEDAIHFVGFQFGSEEYVIEIHLIQEIIMVGNITPVPHVQEFFEGVINLRGNIVPVINLRLKLEMENKPINNDSRIIIVELGETTVGYLVDEITKVIKLPRKNIEPATSAFGAISEEYMNGIGRLENQEDIVGWLDVYKIIETELEEIAQD